MKWLRDEEAALKTAENKGREEGREEGRQQGKLSEKLSIAQSMLGKGFERSLIKEVTGLSDQEIDSL